MKNDLCKLTNFRVTRAFIRNTKSVFLTKSKKDRDFDGHHFSMKNTARNFDINGWLDFGSVLKLLHVEIVSL